MQGRLSLTSDLVMHKTACPKAPMSWRIRNALRWAFIRGWMANKAAIIFSRLTGLPIMTSELALKLRKANGETVDYGVVGYRVVTDAGVAFIVDAFQNSVELEIMNYHGVGTGTTAEAAGDTALVTESTTILNPNSTRATGTQAEPATNQYRSTGTLTFDGSGAITEHGLFSVSSTGSGVLLDRTVFSAVNVASGDSLTSQYTLTLTAGS